MPAEAGDPDEGDERDDAALLAAHVAGDSDAFGVLFRRHRDRLWAVALRTMGAPESAADGLQDGMVAAYRRAGSFRGDAAVTTWLHRVVVNACLDRLRAQKVRRADPLPEQLEEYDARARGTGGAGVEPLASGSAADARDPADEAVSAERRRRVLAALAELPAQQRAALVLVDMEGYPVAEVAEMLDCKVGTVKSRCARGRARLASRLADLVGPPGPDREPDDGNHVGSGAVPEGGGGTRGPPA
ncbi:MAG: RNA polymerase sigma factor SigM [Nocardioides sp.]|nr:RNA polymerase sigma factor SigM [Nocardioides sp.]